MKKHTVRIIRSTINVKILFELELDDTDMHTDVLPELNNIESAIDRIVEEYKVNGDEATIPF